MELPFFPHIPKDTVIAVGMSGGVDSSVSAYLLKHAGYQVIGLFMKNWDDDTGACTVKDDADDVARVCDTIGIPYYSLNFTKEYQESVFRFFIDELKRGKTPNPDILCNREIKFKLLLDHAIKMGAHALATGHYAQNIQEENQLFLKKGCDPGKDQTYFLYTLNQEILKKALFPIGHLHKKEVREIARRAGLATAEKKDSTGICFIGKRNFRQFLQDYLPFKKGLFKKLDGTVVGEHHGVAYYTIGQRKGLGIGGKGDAWFVVKKDPEQNIVYIEQGEQHPALFSYTLTCSEPTWISGHAPALPFACKAKIRYRQEDQLCIIEKEEKGLLHVRFVEPQRAITPEQSIVFYDGTICLGGAIIEEAGPSLFNCNK
jgi:tRNA-specific 2-thiouridylase